MSYAEQLTIIILTGFGTLTWKVALAIAKERKEQRNTSLNRLTKEVSLRNSKQWSSTWPTPAPVKTEVGKKILVMLLASCSLACLANVTADFNADKFSGCPPLLVNFSNLSAGVTTVFWDFGNGNTSTLAAPAATFLTSGTYRVKLLVKNGTQSDSITKTVRVFRLPVVNFTASKTMACLNDTIHFLNQVTPGDAPVTNYAWGFGNGIASSNPNADYRYNQTGIYNITLVVQDLNRCSANKTISGYIQIYPSPVAAFTATPASSCSASQQVTFTNQSTGNGLSYFWDLGDSATSALASPVHTYYQEIRHVKLTIIDSMGCHAQASELVSATDIIANFKASKTLACTNEKINFTNISNFPGSSWVWNFGDGTTSTGNNPVKQYAAPGTYTISFKIKEGACGDSTTKVGYIHIVKGFNVNVPGFSADTTVSCGAPLRVHFTNTTPGGASYLWNFGNGDTSNLQNPSMVFTGSGNYNITLTVTDTSGCSITGTLINFIQTARPVAKFTSDTLTCSGGAIHYTNHSTNASSFLWNFGDGDTSTLSSPTHTYLHRGHYNVKLTAFNRAGCDTSVIKMNYIHVDSVKVDFNLNSTFSPCPPFVCVMNNRSARNVIKFAWDFGDGYTDTAANPTHIYFFPGIYTVKLIGHTAQGCTDTVIKLHLVTVQGPTGNFTVSPKTGCVPLDVNFLASVSSNTLRFWCDLGDGIVVPDSLAFNHTYAGVRIYHPQFILTDHIGCTVSYPLDSITAYSSPALKIKDTSVCAGTALHVSLNQNTNHYQWTPSTFLSCDTCSDLIISAATSTSYTVMATNDFGCQTSASFNLGVDALPQLKDSVVVTLCKKDTCRLFAGSAPKIIWSPATYLSDTVCATPGCAPLTSMVYTVRASNNQGCSAETRVTVQVNDKLDISVPDSVSSCPGGKVQLSAKLNMPGVSGVQYRWSPAQYLDNPDIAAPIATLNDGPVQFQVIASNGHCDADTQIVKAFTIVPEMQVSGTVTTTPYSEVSLAASSTGALTYKWTAKDPLSCEDCGSTTIRPSVSQVAYVEGQNQMGCTVKDSVTIVVNEDGGHNIFIPNAFTPNSDGNNDMFEIFGNLESLKVVEVQIFNRWGEIVFASNNSHFKWDGTYKGELQNPGVFTYQLQLAFNDGQPEKVKSGTVTLLR